jgi:CheY-like chemotaxis protein
MISSGVVPRANILPYFLSDSPPTQEGEPSGSSLPIDPDKAPQQSVLVVDDEELIADSMAEILNRNGYSATAKYSGVAAIQFAKEKCPDIVVSDVIMPDCNGVQLAKMIRLQCPATRILLFSGNAATSNLLDLALSEGYFFELLAKPVHPAQLLKALKS